MRLKNKVLGGVLLVSGTTIGAGMLALPVVTGLAGFIPALCLFLAYWAYMTFTAFLLLEVNLSLGENVNMITMARRTLGRGGEIVSWCVYLFLLYSLTAAYLAGSGPIVTSCIHLVTGWELPSWTGAFPLLFIFAFFVYEGTKYADLLNRWLMLGLILTYGLMVGLIAPYVEPQLLGFADWKMTLGAVSIAATSFGYHIIIPTLTSYLHGDARKLKQVILIGSLIPLGVYIIWELITLGVLPLEGSNGIKQAYQEGTNGAKLLGDALGNSTVALVAQFFSFFAIVTSFLGVTLSLSDFLADGLRIKKDRSGRLILDFLTFAPPLLFILTYPRAFLSALEFAGAFGVVILLGVLPCLMAWSGRYHKGLKGPFRVPGGKLALIAAITVSIIVILIEIGNKCGLFSK